MPPKEIPLFSASVEALSLVLDLAGRFPRSVRPTLGQRLIDRALDVVEGVVALRYSRERDELFQRANLSLEQVRVLSRVAFERRLVSTRQFERLADQVDGVGRQLGGWRRSLEKESGAR
jgi:hypothetical protein